MPTCFLNPAIDRLPFSISQCLTAHQFYFCEASHGTANIPTSGKTLNVVREINLKYTRGGRVSAPAPLKLIQMLVHGRCQDCELLIKQLSLNFASRKYLKQGGEARLWPRHKIVLKLTLCCILSLRRGYFFCWTPSEGFVFHFIWRSFKVFDWMWSVWKHCIEYLCIFFSSFFWWHRRDVLLQFKLSSGSVKKRLTHSCQVFQVVCYFLFQQQTGRFLYNKAQDVKKTLNPPTSKYKYWKMHKKQVSDSSFLWRAYF